jgi:hypothetical protein
VSKVNDKIIIIIIIIIIRHLAAEPAQVLQYVVHGHVPWKCMHLDEKFYIQ